jgi:hypothetical protein
MLNPPMPTWGVTRIKNEEDVIEAFVRHHLFHLDHLLVLDDGSTDATPAILQALVDEGLALTLRREDRPGVPQAEVITGLIREAAQQGADWIFLLDADEFLQIPGGGRIRMPADGPDCITLDWITYVTSAEDDPGEANPVKRLCRRLAREPWAEAPPEHRSISLKAAVRGRLARAPGTEAMPGNHGVLANGMPVPTSPHTCTKLAHYPIRSPEQYASKVALSVLQKMSRPAAAIGLHSHYSKHMEEILKDYEAYRRDFSGRLPSYFPADAGRAGTTKDPMDYRGGPLRYTPPMPGTGGLIRNLIRHGEILARSYGQALAGQASRPGVAMEFTLRGAGGSGAVPLVVGSCEPARLVLPWPGRSGHPSSALEVEWNSPPGVLECLGLEWARSGGAPVAARGVDIPRQIAAGPGAEMRVHETRVEILKGRGSAVLRIVPPEPEAPFTRVTLGLLFDPDAGRASAFAFKQQIHRLQQQVESLQSEVRRLERSRRPWISRLLSGNR